VLTLARDLTALTDIRLLEAEVVAHDGGRLKLELDYVLGHPIDLALWYEGSRLVGYAGVYAFGGGSTPEIAGMVAPDRRRRGVGTALLEALLPFTTGRTPLLVVPAGTEAGRAFALSRQGTPSHSEHHLVLGATPTTAEDPATVLRLAAPEDVPELERILSAAFDEPNHGLRLDRAGDTTYAIEHDGALVGHVRLSVSDGTGGVYGFAVEPALQGKGIGRDVLARCCRLLRAEGRDEVTLEVETENANALRLYTSTGFVHESGEDYWALPTSS
jgi:ribosomal protein S18 acetylase RimI-like enzyme